MEPETQRACDASARTARVSRRSLLAMPFVAAASTATTDARIEEVNFDFADFRYRAPYKFGGKEVDRVTILNVHCRVSSKAGRSATGFASMPLGSTWSFPAAPYDEGLAAMKSLAPEIAKITLNFREYAHPLDVNRTLEPEYIKAAAVPKLCALVTASPFDAALHDAYGRLHNRNAFNCCGRDFVRYDLSHYLDESFRGEYLDAYVSAKCAPRVRMYHSVGASDPLTPAEVTRPIHDGLPECLEAWIPYSGVTAIKIKLNGADLAWDAARVAAIDRVATAAQQRRGVHEWIY